MRRQLSYQFDLDIERVHLLINMKCEVQVWWKSGKGKIATKNAIKLSGNEKFFDVNEKLSIIAKLVIQNGVMRQKKTELVIVLFTGVNTSKLGGKVFLNLNQLVQNAIGNGGYKGSNFSRRIEKKLENCPDELSRIIFNLSCKYIEENEADSLHDISFQANNLSSFGAGKNPDMTFRPDHEKQRNQSRQYQRRDSQRQKEQPMYMIPNHRAGSRENGQRVKKEERPMQFSFNPISASERQKMGLDNTQLIKDLKQIVEEKSRDIKRLQEELSRVKTQQSERNSAKSISLFNQLNSTIAKNSEMEREIQDLKNKNEQLREEKRKIEEYFTSYKADAQADATELVAKLEQRKKMVEEMNNQLEQKDKKLLKMQDEAFRKENQLLNREKEIDSLRVHSQNSGKEQAEKIRNISIALQELKHTYEVVFEQKQSYRKRYEEVSKIKRQEGEEMSLKVDDLEERLIEAKRQKQVSENRYKMMEAKYKEREEIIHEIQNQFHSLQVQNNTQNQHSLQKDTQLNVLREKIANNCKKISELEQKEESMRIQISEQIVKIKTLESICEQLEHSNEEKEELMKKAKEYIALKEQQLKKRDEQIEKRDEFIQKIKLYMENKQKQFNDLLQNSSETSVLKNQLKQKQKALGDQIKELQYLHKQIQDMDNCINGLKDRLMDSDDYIDELQRKNESQEETLKDLVKKNLNMEIQINMKEYQISSLKSAR